MRKSNAWIQNGVALLSGVVLLAGVSPADVRVWQTRIDDGTRREKTLRIDQFGVDQDSGYELLKEMPAIKTSAAPKGQGIRITIDTGQSFQTVQGLGASMTDSSAFVLFELRKRSPELYQFVMERLFSADKGAGFSFLRQPMGSSDYTATREYYTYADKPSADLSSFSIEHDRAYIIPMLKDALRINPDIELMGTPWSAPGWLKTNDSLLGITKEQKAAGSTCRLKPETIDLYAEYFVKYVQAYKQEGLSIGALTLQNEPQFDAAQYPCMRMPPEDMARLIGKIGPRFKALGITTGVFAHDHNWILHPNDREVIGGDRKIDPLETVTQLFSDPATGGFWAGSAWHCYAGNTQDMQRVYQTLRKQFPDKKVYCTEISAWRRLSQTDWFDSVRWGLRNNWLGALLNGASVATEWNLALDHKYGPTLRDDSLAIGLVTIHTDSYKSVRFEREFYAMAHVSKAARPGAVLVKAAISEGAGLEAGAFALKSGRYSLVVFNPDGKERSFEVQCKDQYFEYSLPARSIATLIWK